MRPIADAQGEKAFNTYTEWRQRYENDKQIGLAGLVISRWPEEKSEEIAQQAPWEVKRYVHLVDRVAFLTSVNYRWLLFFRGQNSLHDPVPRLIRNRWKCLDEDPSLAITNANRSQYWTYLNDVLGPEVGEVCLRDGGAPNFWHIRNVREAQWALIQHYGLWPTPLIDLTLNLRVAASFAFHGNEERDEPIGYLFVVGMPEATGSITHDPRERTVLIRLQSACPPIAKRTHYQDGYLVGHYPFYDMNLGPFDVQKLEEFNLNRRLIAIFKLDNSDGQFWTADFPKIERKVLYPPENEDRLRRIFRERFGKENQESSLQKEALKFANVAP